jgi:hypothetical protein
MALYDRRERLFRSFIASRQKPLEQLFVALVPRGPASIEGF